MIHVKNLWKRFDQKVVLKGVNLEIPTGKTIVILGQSGAGKSVLLRHIMGIEEPDEGEIEIDGIEITKLKEEKRYVIMKEMGMLFQNSALFDSLSIEENTGFYLKEHTHLSRMEIEEKVAAALEMVGLKGTQKLMPADLSGGMRKRAALARLIVYRPRFLLYDEPTTGLDPITAMQINDLILTTQKELGATSIVVTHDLCSALHVADLIALNHEGKILHCTTKEQFIRLEDPVVRAFLKNSIPEGELFHEKKNP